MTGKIGSTANIRELNQEVILAALRKCGCASIAELAKLTDLSIATCVKIVGELAESGEVWELEERESKGGRPARQYRFNPNYSLVAALILRVAQEKESIFHFVADSIGNVIQSGSTDVDSLDTEAIDSLLERLKKEHPALKAVSLSIPGMVANGVIGAGDVPRLTGVRLEEHIKARHGLIASAENDMNFAALGYYKCHAHDGRLGLAYLLFPRGYCTGGGLVVNDRLVRGRSGFAGELSYMTFVEKRRDLRRLLANPKNRREYTEYVAKMVMAVTTVVNPSVVVLSGDDMTGDMAEDILAFCARDIDPEHLPKLVIKREYSDDCLDGMIVQALSSLARFPQLLEFAPGDSFALKTAE